MSVLIGLIYTTQNSSILENLEWRNIGPDRGGRSLAVSGSSSRINEYYFGAVGGGLWKTTDGGVSWKPVTDGQIKSSSVGAVAVANSNPDILCHLQWLLDGTPSALSSATASPASREL